MRGVKSRGYKEATGVMELRYCNCNCWEEGGREKQAAAAAISFPVKQLFLNEGRSSPKGDINGVSKQRGKKVIQERRVRGDIQKGHGVMR